MDATPPVLRRAALALAAMLFLPVSTARAEPPEAGFPCHSVQTLSFPADMSAVGRKVERGEPVRILAIGSSSTEGAGASAPQLSYPARLEQKLRAAYAGASLVIENAGKGGETADQTFARLKSLVETRTYDLVLWQVGTNDAADPAATARLPALLRDGIGAARAAGAALLIIDPQFTPSPRDPARLEEVVRQIREVSAEENVPLFSRYAMMQGWNSRSEADLVRTLAGDRFHMSDVGYGCLAQELARDLRPLFTASVSARR